MSAEIESLLVHDEPVDGGVVRVFTMNRPTKRNALDSRLIDALLSGMLAADDDVQVRAIVLVGAAGHFSGGGDLREFTDEQVIPKVERARKLGELVLLSQRMATPVIAAVRGATVGGGAAIALSADMVVAGDDVTFGFPELMRSIMPTTVMVGLARQLGSRYAFELLTTGRFIGAAEALEHRMVNRVVPAEEALTEAMALAESISAIDPHAMRSMKRLFYTGQDLSDSAAMDAGMDSLRAALLPHVT